MLHFSILFNSSKKIYNIYNLYFNIKKKNWYFYRFIESFSLHGKWFYKNRLYERKDYRKITNNCPRSSRVRLSLYFFFNLSFICIYLFKNIIKYI